MNDYSELARFACNLADAARDAVLPHFRAQTKAQSKDDSSPVTIADRNAEEKMRLMINKTYPAHGVIGEEFGDENTDAETVWALDPIDGTRSFITGSPLFCSLIAVLRGGVPVIGVIDMPALNERWLGIYPRHSRAGGNLANPKSAEIPACAGMTGGDECAALFNNQPCKTSACESLADATMITTTLGYGGDKQNESLKNLCAAACARFGGDGGAYGCVASGFADIACDCEMHAHDYLALAPIVRAAGGCISDWRGNENLNSKTGKTEIIASATSQLHKQALEKLK